MDSQYLTQLAAQARAVLQRTGAEAPDYAPTRLTVNARTLTELQAVRQAVEAFAPQAGWIMYASKTECWPGEWKEEHGPVLHAEFAKGETQSLHVRYTNGAWSLVEFTEGEGETVLAHSCHFEAVAGFRTGSAAISGLDYRVYHREEQPEWGLRPFQARFVGFERKQS